MWRVLLTFPSSLSGPWKVVGLISHVSSLSNLRFLFHCQRGCFLAHFLSIKFSILLSNLAPIFPVPFNFSNTPRAWEIIQPYSAFIDIVIVENCHTFHLHTQSKRFRHPKHDVTKVTPKWTFPNWCDRVIYFILYCISPCIMKWTIWFVRTWNSICRRIYSHFSSFKSVLFIISRRHILLIWLFDC